MKDTLFIAAFLLVSLFVLSNGILMLLWPGKHTVFEDWLARSKRWSKPNPDWKPGPNLEKRFAGVVAVAVAILMLRLPIAWILYRRPLSWVRPQYVPATGFHWVEFVAAVTISTVGLYLVIRPAAYARWMMRITSQRLYPDDFVKRGALGLRIFGTLVAALGVYMLYFVFAG